MTGIETATLNRLLEDLAPVGRDPSTGGYRRLAYTPAELTLREWFAGEAATRSMDCHEDRAGNLWAWWGDPTAGDAVVTGSHLDSVPQGGAYDGPLGVVAGFAAVDRLREQRLKPTRPIAVTAFADEEGARFGAACIGSRLLSGQLDVERALGLRDDDGVTMAEALRRTGRDPQALGSDPDLLHRIGAFVELHIEQGRGLVAHDAPVGAGSWISAHGRWRFELEGRADHAGTTRLEDREDPMLRMAEAVLAARTAAERHRGLATVGRVHAEPNAVNAIPSRACAWLDARGADEETVRAIVADVSAAAGAMATEESWTPRVDLDPDLRARLVASLDGIPVLPTGAGHDAGVLAQAGIPTAMLFVRNPTGVSHSPDEHVERPDCQFGVRALAHVLEDLACG